MDKVQIPSVGRRMHYRGGHGLNNLDAGKPAAEQQPMDAGVVYVLDESTVNVIVTDHGGQLVARNAVQVRQPHEPIPDGEYVEWMEYQNKKHAQDAAGTTGA